MIIGWASISISTPFVAGVETGDQPVIRQRPMDFLTNVNAGGIALRYIRSGDELFASFPLPEALLFSPRSP